jgi:hypothetical protein
VPDGVQHTGQREVVDVVPGAVGQRAMLAPSRHPRVDQTRVTGQTVGRTDAQPLGDAGAQPLDQHVGSLDQAQHSFPVGGVLEVERHRAATAKHLVALARDELQATWRAFHSNDVSAQISQQHRRMRARTDPSQLDHPQSGQRSRHRTPPHPPCELSPASWNATLTAGVVISSVGRAVGDRCAP